MRNPAPLLKPFAVFGPFLFATILSGCGGSGSGNGLPSPTSPPSSSTTKVSLRPVSDLWSAASPRWRDIANTPYSSGFKSSFSYASGQVNLTFQRAPGASSFVGHISASGLKPNFAYQIKLAGKPVSGNRGWGTSRSWVEASSKNAGATPVSHDVPGTSVGGDDWTNQQLGYAGRWWDDTTAPSTNLDDAYFRANYPSHTIYGYLFLGDFVTDANGQAETDVRGDRSLHITWQDAQNGPKNSAFGIFPVSRTAYAYDEPLENASQTLWYELEAGRPQPVRLPAGTYHCRVLITEEAFHGAGGQDGGVWQTVLTTEDAGDQNADNDVVFSIK